MEDDAAVLNGFLLTIVFVALIALIPAVIAAKKGRNPIGWYFYGFFLWIVALIHSIMLAPVRTCRFCAEAIKPAASVCPHCQRDLSTPRQGADANKPVGLLLGDL